MINCKVTAEDKRLYLFHSFDDSASSGICREHRLETRFTATHPDIVIDYKTFRFNGVGGADQKQTVECALKLEKAESITTDTTIADCTCKDACDCDSDGAACLAETAAAQADDSEASDDSGADDTSNASDNSGAGDNSNASDNSGAGDNSNASDNSGASQSQNMLSNANAAMPTVEQPTVEETTVTTLEPPVEETTTTTLNSNSALQSTVEPTVQQTIQPTVQPTVQQTVQQNAQPTNPPEFLARDDNINEGIFFLLHRQKGKKVFFRAQFMQLRR